MTSIEATLLVALGGGIASIVLGAIGGTLSQNNQNRTAVPFLAFAMFGLGTCIISLCKAILMALGV